MKKISTILLLFVFLFSCGNNDEVSDIEVEEVIKPTSIFGKWNLSKTTTGSIGLVILPSESNRHSYTLYGDGTFKRVSIENNVVTTLIGTFIVTDTHAIIGYQSGRNLIFAELFYSSPNVDFESCWPYTSIGILGNKELLILTPDDKLMNYANGECHGDIFEYAKEE